MGVFRTSLARMGEDYPVSLCTHRRRCEAVEVKDGRNAEQGRVGWIADGDGDRDREGGSRLGRGQARL